MSTPKIDPVLIEKLTELSEEYLEAHEVGGYRPNSVRIRRGHAHAFLLYLAGDYDPATDFGKRRK